MGRYPLLNNNPCLQQQLSRVCWDALPLGSQLHYIYSSALITFSRLHVPLLQEDIIHEAQTMKSYHHPNVLSLYTSFVHGQDLWMVTPFMSGGSVLHIMKYRFPKVCAACRGHGQQAARPIAAGVRGVPGVLHCTAEQTYSCCVAVDSAHCHQCGSHRLWHADCPAGHGWQRSAGTAPKGGLQGCCSCLRALLLQHAVVSCWRSSQPMSTHPIAVSAAADQMRTSMTIFQGKASSQQLCTAAAAAAVTSVLTPFVPATGACVCLHHVCRVLMRCLLPPL